MMLGPDFCWSTEPSRLYAGSIRWYEDLACFSSSPNLRWRKGQHFPPFLSNCSILNVCTKSYSFMCTLGVGLLSKHPQLVTWVLSWIAIACDKRLSRNLDLFSLRTTLPENFNHHFADAGLTWAECLTIPAAPSPIVELGACCDAARSVLNVIAPVRDVVRLAGQSLKSCTIERRTLTFFQQ